MLLLRAFARLIEVLLMIAIALVGIGIGLYCLGLLISLGSARPDRLLHLSSVRDHVGHFLTQTAAPGSVATLALLGGIVSVIIGALLLLGLLGSRREHVLVIETDAERGGLYARTRALSRMARDEAERAPGVLAVKRPKVKLRRSGHHGRLKIRASRGPDPELAVVDDAVHERLDPFAESLHLTPDVRVRLRDPDAPTKVDA
jgi:hypothetical protein